MDEINKELEGGKKRRRKKNSRKCRRRRDLGITQSK